MFPKLKSSPLGWTRRYLASKYTGDPSLVWWPISTERFLICRDLEQRMKCICWDDHLLRSESILFINARARSCYRCLLLFCRIGVRFSHELCIQLSRNLQKECPIQQRAVSVCRCVFLTPRCACPRQTKRSDPELCWPFYFVFLQLITKARCKRVLSIGVAVKMKKMVLAMPGECAE